MFIQCFMDFIDNKCCITLLFGGTLLIQVLPKQGLHSWLFIIGCIIETFRTRNPRLSHFSCLQSYPNIWTLGMVMYLFTDFTFNYSCLHNWIIRGTNAVAMLKLWYISLLTMNWKLMSWRRPLGWAWGLRFYYFQCEI